MLMKGVSYLKKNFKTLWPLFMDGVQLPQGYSHFEEAVYFLLRDSVSELVFSMRLDGTKDIQSVQSACSDLHI